MLSPSLVSACEIVSLPLRRLASRLLGGGGALAGTALGPGLAFVLFLFLGGLACVQRRDLRRGGFARAIGDPLALFVFLLLGFALGLLLAFSLPAQPFGLVGDLLFLLLDAPKLFHLALAPGLRVKRYTGFDDRLGRGRFRLSLDVEGIGFLCPPLIALGGGPQRANPRLSLFRRQLPQLWAGPGRRGFGTARGGLGLRRRDLGDNHGGRRLNERALRLDLDGHLLRPAMRELLTNLGRDVRAAPLQFKLGPARQAQDFLRFLLFILAHDSPVSTSSPVQPGSRPCATVSRSRLSKFNVPTQRRQPKARRALNPDPP
jgi:hypothetical protein